MDVICIDDSGQSVVHFWKVKKGNFYIVVGTRGDFYALAEKPSFVYYHKSMFAELPDVDLTELIKVEEEACV